MLSTFPLLLVLWFSWSFLLLEYMQHRCCWCVCSEQGWSLNVIIGDHGNQAFVDAEDIEMPLINYWRKYRYYCVNLVEAACTSTWECCYYVWIDNIPYS